MLFWESGRCCGERVSVWGIRQVYGVLWGCGSVGLSVEECFGDVRVREECCEGVRSVALCFGVIWG